MLTTSPRRRSHVPAVCALLTVQQGMGLVSAAQRQHWFNTIVSCRDVSSNAWRVASVIGFSVFVGKDSCHLSYDTLAERSAFSRRAVINFVKELEAGGWITIHRTGGRRANTFVLTLPSPLKFPDEETRQLADIAALPTVNIRDQGGVELSGGDDAARANGARVGAPLEAGEQRTVSDSVTGNSARAGAPFEMAEQCTSLCTDANGQQCTEAASTVHELVHPKRRKERYTYSPLGADDGKHSALFERLWALWGGGGFEDRAKRRFDKTLMDGVDPAIIIAAAERRRKRLDRFGLREAGRLYLWLRRGDWQREPDVPKQVFVEQGTKAGRAWERNWLEAKRVRPPWQSVREQGFKRGWYFPSEFPPEDAVL